MNFLEFFGNYYRRTTYFVEYCLTCGIVGAAVLLFGSICWALVGLFEYAGYGVVEVTKGIFRRNK